MSTYLEVDARLPKSRVKTPTQFLEEVFNYEIS